MYRRRTPVDWRPFWAVVRTGMVAIVLAPTLYKCAGVRLAHRPPLEAEIEQLRKRFQVAYARKDLGLVQDLERGMSLALLEHTGELFLTCDSLDADLVERARRTRLWRSDTVLVFDRRVTCWQNGYGTIETGEVQYRARRNRAGDWLIAYVRVSPQPGLAPESPVITSRSPDRRAAAQDARR